MAKDCGSGKHAGIPWTHIPLKDLKAMIRAPEDKDQKRFAQDELARRGRTMSENRIAVSNHAIDRASLLCSSQWLMHRAFKNEGLASWLLRVATDALEKGRTEREGVKVWLGIKFVFSEDKKPVLVTVHPA